MIDVNQYAPILTAVGVAISAVAATIAAITIRSAKTKIDLQGRVLAEVHVNTNSRLDSLFAMLKSERIAAENEADLARNAVVAASSKATQDVAIAVATASDRTAKHALTAMPPPGVKS